MTDRKTTAFIKAVRIIWNKIKQPRSPEDGLLLYFFYSVFILISPLLFTLFLTSQAIANTRPTILRVIEKNLMVNGKPSKVFDIVQPNGVFGYVGTKNGLFDVIVENKTRVPLVLHWHGIVDPNDQDGVPYVTQLPIAPGKNYHYQFKLNQAGTFWFHSHYKLQEQKLMAAPLIIHDPNGPKEHEVLMFIQDFTFENPSSVYMALKNKYKKAMTRQTKITDHEMKPMNHAMKGAMNSSPIDVSDVKFDAYLTNHRTLRNPEIVRVRPNETIRLRMINASSSSNYTIDLGKLTGKLFAIDGSPIKPITGTHFQIAIGNRLDIRIKLPQGENAYPILALPEGTKAQTGLVLATAKAKILNLPEERKSVNPKLDYSQELKSFATQPFNTKPISQSLPYTLDGNMMTYRWTLNGEVWPYITPYKVRPNERTELIFINKSHMAHPMHIHGHVFQITEIDGKPIQGRKGDTVNVMPNSTVKVVFDTHNPGIWMLHCHILYHQQGGMMTTFNYLGYPEKFTQKERVEAEKLYQ